MAKTAPKTPPGHDLNSKTLVKSYVISLLISIPLLGFTVLLSQYHAGWKAAHLIFWMILFVSIGNFLALILLEQFRAQMGSFTIPALLSACGLIVFLTIVEGVNRFIPIMDFHWLYSFIALVIIFKYLAIFKERNLALKFYLAVNIIALALLWNLGNDHKVVLPF
jgi:hypothetical protein